MSDQSDFDEAMRDLARRAAERDEAEWRALPDAEKVEHLKRHLATVSTMLWDWHSLVGEFLAERKPVDAERLRLEMREMLAAQQDHVAAEMEGDDETEAEHV